jgi:hypothetical protein
MPPEGIRGTAAAGARAPASGVNARTNAGGLELIVPAERYAVEATVHRDQVEARLHVSMAPTVPGAVVVR